MTEITDCPLKELIKSTSWAQALNLPGLGKIQSGFAADIVVLEDDFSPAAVFVNGARKF